VSGRGGHWMISVTELGVISNDKCGSCAALPGSSGRSHLRAGGDRSVTAAGIDRVGCTTRGAKREKWGNGSFLASHLSELARSKQTASRHKKVGTQR
jgi:hypothetical protein